MAFSPKKKGTYKACDGQRKRVGCATTPRCYKTYQSVGYWMGVSSVSTVDDYLDSVEPAMRAPLAELRGWIRAAVPKARETIRYGMPYYEHHGLLCAFAKKKDHVSLYVLNRLAIEQMREQLFGIAVTKGRVRIDAIERTPKEEVFALLERAARLNERGVGVYASKRRKMVD
jgi:uncharacterized protein YdhG (YjbR/CyaY superfamily)